MWFMNYEVQCVCFLAHPMYSCQNTFQIHRDFNNSIGGNTFGRYELRYEHNISLPKFCAGSEAIAIFSELFSKSLQFAEVSREEC